LIIAVGSKNPIKIGAVAEAAALYASLAEAKIIGMEVSSDVSEQPKDITETIHGAIKRAMKSYNSSKDHALGVGLESGLQNFPYTGLMELSVCCIYDGQRYHFGFSPAFRCPKDIQKLMEKHQLNLSEASYRAGYTNNRQLGMSEGLVGILTQGKKTRKEYTRDAVIMALIKVKK